MSLPVSVLASIETAINRYLHLDPEGVHAFGDLQGRVIAIEILGPGQTIYLLPHRDGINVLGNWEGETDTRLSGGPLALLRMSLGSDVSDSLFAGDVKIQGDTETGQRFKEMFDRLEIDWEGQLAKLTGDVAARQTGRTIRGAKSWGNQALQTWTQNLSEYLQEEARLLPSKIEIDNFLDDIDKLRMATDRLAAKLNKLSTPDATRTPVKS